MSTRSYRRYAITEIITKAWKLSSRIQIEKLNENVFKFTFSSKKDMDYIFNLRPWSLNGANLILKEWPIEKTLSEINFDTSSFYLQVHGLPPIFLHGGTAKMVGSKIGAMLQSPAGKRCVVANRYLRFRVEIPVKKPLPAGFFMERNDGNDVWIQFKLERLSEFCYTCGFLDHTTGRCKISALAMVTSPIGISAKIFGPWIRAENGGSVCFINTPVTEDRAGGMVNVSAARDLARILREMKEANRKVQTYHGKDAKEIHADLEYEKFKELCPELTSLEITLTRHEVGSRRTLQAIVLDKTSDANFGLGHLSKWASELLMAFGSKRNIERMSFDGLECNNPSNRPQGERESNNSQVGFSRKRPALQDLETRPAKVPLSDYSNPDSHSTKEIAAQTLCISQIEIADAETPSLERRSHLETEHDRPRRTWSWKREARRSGERVCQNGMGDRGESSSSRTDTRRHLDFL